MGKKEALLAKLFAKKKPTDFAWKDIVTLLNAHGFQENCTGGSHYMFEHTSGYRFSMSKTHPSGVLKVYQVSAAKTALKHVGVEK